MSKTTVQTLGNVSGDYLKWEASYQTREAVPAPVGTKAGTFVDYPLRGKKLVAISDEHNGQVLVQPHNCIIDVSLLSAAVISAALGGTTDAPKTLHDLQLEGDAHGIVYRGTPQA